MIDLIQMFPKFYSEVLEQISIETALVHKRVSSQLESQDEQVKAGVLAYTHNYQAVMTDAFHALELSRYLDRHPEELTRYADQHPTFDLDALCVELEHALKNDHGIQQRIYNIMRNHNYYVLKEEYEDCVIQNVPEGL